MHRLGWIVQLWVRLLLGAHLRQWLVLYRRRRKLRSRERVMLSRPDVHHYFGPVVWKLQCLLRPGALAAEYHGHTQSIESHGEENPSP